MASRNAHTPKRGERFCLVCEKILRVGFADNRAHAQSAEHIANYARKFGPEREKPPALARGTAH